MGKIMRVRMKSRISRCFSCCSHAPLSPVEDGDFQKIFEAAIPNPDANDDMVSEASDDKESLIAESDELNTEEENAGSGSEDSSIDTCNSSSTSYLFSCDDIARDETGPKRPDSIEYAPTDPQEYRMGTGKILDCLADQSGKLDRILAKLEDSPTTGTFREEVHRFWEKIENFSHSIHDSIKKSTTAATNNDESLFLTQHSRIASQHDEGSASSQRYSEGSGSVATYTPLDNSGTTCSNDLRSEKISWFPSRTPREHEVQSESFTSHSSEHAQIIRDQFNELKRCATEHSSQCGSSEANEVNEVISRMEAQIVTLPKNSPVLLRIDSNRLRTQSFMRTSYPTPSEEIIEMKNLSPGR